MANIFNVREMEYKNQINNAEKNLNSYKNKVRQSIQFCKENGNGNFSNNHSQVVEYLIVLLGKIDKVYLNPINLFYFFQVCY